MPKISRSLSTKIYPTFVVFLGQESVMSIIPDQFPGIVFEPKKTCFFSSSGCWFFQFQTFRGLGLGVVGSSRFGCERRMDDTKVYKHGRNDAEFCMLHLLPKNVKQTL